MHPESLAGLDCDEGNLFHNDRTFCPQMRVVFLGTGGTYPCKERNVLAIAVQIGKNVLLMDCGEGTQRQFMRSNVSFMSTRWIFITHYHGDHFLGVPGLIQSMNLNNRDKPLDIYGPRGTRKVMKSILLAGHFLPEFGITSHDVAPGESIPLDGFSVTVAEADHSVPSLAFAVKEDDRPGRFDIGKAKSMGIPEGPLFRELQNGRDIEFSGRRVAPEEVMGPPRSGLKIIYSGDTKPCKSIIELARGADLLIHDSTLLSSEERQAEDFGHSTALGAAKVANESMVKKMALIHFSPRYKDASVLEEEARTLFPEAYAPSDLDEMIVKLD